MTPKTSTEILFGILVDCIQNRDPLAIERERMQSRRVLVGKIDLDTIGTAYLLGVNREDKIEVIKGEAPPVDLADPKVICIEVGGSGQVHLMNFDHHGEDAPKDCAMRQTFEWFVSSPEGIRLYHEGGVGVWEDDFAGMLTGYIETLDVEGPEVLRRELDFLGISLEEGFPFLSDVITGMMLLEKDPREQLHKGVEILRILEASDDWDSMFHKKYTFFVDNETNIRGETQPWVKGPYPEILPIFGPINLEVFPEFKPFIAAKLENRKQVSLAIRGAQWGKTAAGLRLGWLETDFIGATGALYGNGAQIVVVYSRHYGPDKVSKFTIAGNGIKVNGVLPELNAREPGWGGPSTGTIIGSPREGSNLSLEEVVEIVRRNL